ncbi:DNA repair exonuclease SbcCD nuclease subunit [Rhodoferax ferrireducens]|uniref:DNA repair exonuclease SbcCD nuclease subunit n=1 Tax=Rhodoferax ferrireducens TaxID=192843 RepID=A0ABU2C3D8_9BURK|nr:DNA repair exonuclease [Rhodoferax ferrireducens]MDR7375846.1 DNA repair exonuclease SbcCD nuclease subunit [Rhodoferax ferrireducens]
MNNVVANPGTFRFLHAADLHIDSPLRGLSRYAGAPVERLRNATRRALENLVDLALAEQVQFVLLAGDLYDRDWPDFHTGLFFREQMVRLGRAQIGVYIVQGNHDAQGTITRELPLPEHVKVFSSRSAETMRIDALGVAIHGRSFPQRAVDEDFVPDYPDAVPGQFNIGMLHTSLTVGGGIHDTYAPTTLPVLKTKGYDYWALGHVHTRDVVCESPRVVFPGNLQGRHANETGPKGCELVTVVGGQMEARFVPLDVVRWHQLQLALDGMDSLAQATQLIAATLADATRGAGDRLHALRVVLTGRSALHGTEAQQPGTLEAAVHAAAQDVAGAELWIEQVQLRLASPIDRARLAQGEDAVAELLRLVDELAADPAALAAWTAKACGDVLHKLPAEAKTDADWSTPAAMQALLLDAEATLLARLGSAA